MDSVTQLTLGAAIGEACLGRRIGGRAALVGAVCGTLPDLDSFLPYGDAVATFTYHRSFSHSLFFLALLAPLLAWFAWRLPRQPPVPYWRWLLLVLLVLLTHPLLDAFTVYGTQLLWPLVEHPFSFSTIFIIDPAYTLPLAIGVLAALMTDRRRLLRSRLNAVGLGVSTLYLAWTVAAKGHVDARVEEALARQDIPHSAVLSTPAPFNTLLWRLVVMTDGGYYEAFYHVLDRPHRVDFTFHADDKALLEGLQEHWPVRRLQWFTHGFYAVREVEGDIRMTDLRMGVEPGYAFIFKVAERTADGIQPVPAIAVPSSRGAEQLAMIGRRVFKPVRRDNID